MRKDKVKVLYIAGVNRSGSTVLTKVLNEIEGFFGVNEIVLIGQFGLRTNRPLSNGEPFNDSKLWNKVLNNAYGEVPHWSQLSYYDQPTPRLANLVLDNFKLKDSEIKKHEDYAKAVTRLYQSIREVTGCQVIVDSSKTPEYAYFLSTLKDIDLYVLNLTRDPRGIFYSHQKVIQRQDMNQGSRILMKRKGMFNFILKYIARNIGSLRLQQKSAHYLKIRYEDFARSPAPVLEKICRFLDYDYPSDLVREDTIGLSKEDHGIWGNPMRKSKDTLKIVHDSQWKDKLLTWQKAAVTILTLPFLLLFKYPLKSK